MSDIDLTQGQNYARRDIHSRYGGQFQYGISTPAKYPYVLLFSAPTGEKYGYDDGWDTEGNFRYSGEGQKGDMTFNRGNDAILNHSSQGKELHLFVQVGQGQVRYEGEFEYQGHEIVEAMDLDGRSRKGILFSLRPVS